MFKSGLIVGAVALLVVAGATLLSPLCAPCAAVFLGLGAGFLAGVFEKPSGDRAAARVGAICGVVGGSGAVLGLIIGAVTLGFPPPDNPAFYANFGAVIGFSLLDVLLMAGFGALGGLLWWQTTGKNATP